MKNVLITGADGQLGMSLKEVLKEGFPFHCTFAGLADLDLTLPDKVQQYISQKEFDYIINCAAYTAVDNAESEPEKAFEVNAQVPRMLGDIVLKKSIRLIHISTDYVFGGEIPIPYTETSPTNPLSVYGKSKLKGELALRNNPNVMILRSAWLFSEFGNNFLKSIYRLGKERADINVVFDQVGSPTYANDLARCIFLIMEYAENKEFLPGIYHYTNEGICSWFDLAWEIIHKTALKCRIHPVTSDEYPLPAKRPSYSVLNKSRIKKVFGLEIPHWKKSLEIAIDRMTKI